MKRFFLNQDNQIHPEEQEQFQALNYEMEKYENQKKTIDEILQSGKKKLRRVFLVIRVVYVLRQIYNDILAYGTSSDLFDLTTRNRPFVRSILYPLYDYQILNDKSKKENMEKYSLPFPMIHPRSKFKQSFNYLLIVAMLYVALILPYKLVFVDEIIYSWELLEDSINYFFILDMIICFVSAYYDEEGQLVSKPGIVAWKYFKTWFFIDLISCIPYDQLILLLTDTSSSVSENVLLLRFSRFSKMQRLIRVTRMIKVFKFLSSDAIFSDILNFNSGIMRLFITMFQVLFIVHLMGCLWYFVAEQNNVPDNWVSLGGYQDAQPFELYLLSIYFTLTTLSTVGYGDIAGNNEWEEIISIFYMFFGVAFYSYFIGMLTSVMQFIAIQDTNLKKNIEIMNELCNQMNITNNLKKKMREILEYNSSNNAFIWIEQTNIFNELPLDLRYDIIMDFHNQALKQINFFSECQDKYFIIKVAPLLRPLFLLQNEKLWNIDEIPDASNILISVYFIVEGRVKLYADKKYYLKNVDKQLLNNKHFDFFNNQIRFKAMVKGSYFGEIEIVLKINRQFEAQCESQQGKFYYLNRNDYEFLVKKDFPHISQVIEKVAIHRQKINHQGLNRIIKYQIEQYIKVLKANKDLSELVDIEKVLSLNDQIKSLDDVDNQNYLDFRLLESQIQQKSMDEININENLKKILNQQQKLEEKILSLEKQILENDKETDTYLIKTMEMNEISKQIINILQIQKNKKTMLIHKQK